MTRLEEMVAKFKELYENNEKAKEFISQLKENSEAKAKIKTEIQSQQASLLEKLGLNIEKIKIEAEENKT